MFNFEKKIRVALILQIAALSFSISQPARAISEAQLFNEPAFVNLYGVILRVNTSMKIAAQNPMDRWRRQAVREAVAQIPPALIGLAEVFESGKLHDGDYQYVMGMLGGFVDQKSAPEIYSKFLKKPSTDLIPKAGSGMQIRLDRESGSAGSRLVYDDNAPSPEGKNAPASAQNNRPQNKEVVNLSSLANYDDKEGASSSQKIVYDESAAGPSGSSLAGSSTKGVAKNSSGSKSTGSATTAPTNSFSAQSRAPASTGNFVSDVQSELSAIEAGVKKDEESDEDLLPIKRQSRAKAGRPAAKPSVAPKQGKPVTYNSAPSQHLATMGFHAQLLSTTFKILPLFYLNAFAAEGQSNCQSCKKGGGQGGGGGGEGGGGGGGGGQQAAQLLFGAAAIMAAIVPAIVASEQADADKEIAQTNAEAQKYMTDAVARNSENLAGMQQETAMYQTQVAAQTAAANNEAVTQRLNQQLQQLDASQQRIAAQEQQQFMAEQELNQKRLELSEAQLSANVAAAQSAQQLQLTQAGLSTGTLPGDSGSSLTTSSTGVAMASAAGTVAESTANTTTGLASAATARGIASTNSGSALPTSTAGASGSAGYATGATGRGMTGSGHETAPVEGAISKPPSDTVVMADTAGSSSSDSESGGSSLSSAFASLMPSSPVTASARLASSIQSSETNFSQSSSQESQIARLLKDNKELNGSSRGMKVKAAPVPQSSGDLRKFIAANDGETKVESESFAQFQQESVRHQGATRGLASTSPSTKSGHGSAAAAAAAAPVGGMASRGMAGRPAAAAYNPPAK